MIVKETQMYKNNIHFLMLCSNRFNFHVPKKCQIFSFRSFVNKKRIFDCQLEEVGPEQNPKFCKINKLKNYLFFK